MAIERSGSGELIRGLGLLAAISIIIGNVIGTGVFIKARVMTCNVGSPTWVMVAWIGAGLLSLAGALTYAELAAMKPHAGGEYVFLRDAYGRVWSFMYGWMQMVIAKPGSQAAVAVGFAIFANDLLKGSLESTLFTTSFFGVKYELTTFQIIAAGMIVLFTFVNLMSVHVGGWLATIFTIIKIGLVLTVGIGAFLLADGSFANFGLSGTGGTCEDVANGVKYGAAGFTFVGGFAAAMLGALWGYDGWNNLTLVAGEVKNPHKNIPLALVGGIITIMLLYVFVHIAYYYVLTPQTIASIPKTGSVAAEVATRFLGAGALALMSAGLMASSAGTLHTSILTGARVPYAMAKDGLMLKSLGKLSSKTRVPIGALILQGIWACVLAFSGSFDALTNYVIFGSWIFYALVTSSIFVFRRKYPNAERPYKAFGYPIVPIVFLVVAGWLLVTNLISSPRDSMVGIILILIGLPIYYLLTKLNKANNGDVDV
ncbi:MAG: APC family permease [Pyrinomonadaceae bacterium]